MSTFLDGVYSLVMEIGQKRAWMLKMIATMLHHVATFRLLYWSLTQSGKMTDASHVDSRCANGLEHFWTHSKKREDCRHHFGLKTKANVF